MICSSVNRFRFIRPSFNRGRTLTPGGGKSQWQVTVSKGGSAPAVWISGFYGSGKSHLASMLAALWTNLQFSDGASAEGLATLPSQVAAPLKELRIAAQRAGGVVAAGDTLGTGAEDPAEATLGIILRAVGLPSDLRAAQVAFWLDDTGILDDVRAELGEGFDTHIRNFILSPKFGAAVLKAKPELAASSSDLGSKLQALFPEPPPVRAAVQNSSTVAAG